ncbi:MAG TPA: OmpA family protein [Chthoniobacterales bacterium]|jgi:outer membrane protein OmpA-like peptidoglycan-associated protein
MRVSEFDDFETQGLLAASKQRNWLWFGLFVSIALHLAVCTYFYRTRFLTIDPRSVKVDQTATFKVRNIDLTPQVDKNSMDQTNPAAKPDPDNAQDQQPDQKKSFDKLLQDIQASAAMPDDLQDVLPDKPKVESDATSLMTEIERSTAQTLSTNPSATREQSILNDSAVSGRPQPALSGTELATSTTIKRPNTFTSKMPADSAGPNKGRAPGFSDLDQLLAQKGPLGSGTQLRMPDDQLFQYDSTELQSSAIGQLQKLAMLIKRNPRATFTVEGYTDSFGPPEYNLDLSQRRADSVKRYLVEVMGIIPEQVQTRGLGQTKFLVQPNPNVGAAQPDIDAEIRRQQPNRRVVIVVHTREG